jgi:hypothetical protein
MKTGSPQMQGATASESYDARADRGDAVEKCPTECEEASDTKNYDLGKFNFLAEGAD